MATFTGPIAIGDLELDATISEKLTFSADVTDYPVEEGMNPTDSTRRKPDPITIEGIVSGIPGTTPERVTPGFENKPQDALNYLDSLVGSGKTVTISTPFRLYTSMMLTDVTVQVDPNKAEELRFTANAKQVRIITGRTVLVKTAKPSGQKLQKKGRQAGQKPTDANAANARSIAKRITDAVGLTKPGDGVDAPGGG